MRWRWVLLLAAFTTPAAYWVGVHGWPDVALVGIWWGIVIGARIWDDHQDEGGG